MTGSQKELHDLLTEQGFRFDKTSSGHYRYESPNGSVYFAYFSALDQRALRNVVTEKVSCLSPLW